MSNGQARKVVFTARFNRALKHYAGKDRKRRKRVSDAINRMMSNLSDPRLHTHPLAGSHAGELACSCGYDCRIVFFLDRMGSEERIVLINVGTHDEVYRDSQP